MQLNPVAKRRHVKIQALINYLQGHAESEFRTLGNYKLSDDAMSFTTIQIFRMWPIGVDLTHSLLEILPKNAF